MLSTSPRGRKVALAGLGAVTLVGALLAATPAQAAGKPSPNPYSPQANGHTYRHGAFASRDTNTKMQAWAHANAAATGTRTLSYGGGVDGIGVTSGTPKVYLVFWGSQWGTQSTDGNGNLTFSSDTAGGAAQAPAACSRASAPAARRGRAS